MGGTYTVNLEFQTKAENRVDITVAKIISSQRRLLVIEAKGQWHRDLYSAASRQLFDHYAIHPDADGQGIYLVYWFGPDEKVAGRKSHGIQNAAALKESIEAWMPAGIKGYIDVFVLDVSSPA